MSRVARGRDGRVLVVMYSKMLYWQKKATLCMHVIKKKTLDAYAAQSPYVQPGARASRLARVDQARTAWADTDRGGLRAACPDAGYPARRHWDQRDPSPRGLAGSVGHPD